MLNFALCFVLVCGLVGCSTPAQSPPSAYPENASISSHLGIPHDSATNYFPASASINPSRERATDTAKRVASGSNMDCDYTYASQCLLGFKAPVLSNFYLGHTIYRLLWSPAFRYPVLLTLDLHRTGGVLKTQRVNRFPESMASPATVATESQPEIQRINQLRRLIRAGQDVLANTERLASATQRLEYTKLSGTPLIITEKVTALNQAQIQEFKKLLNEADFWQLSSCELPQYVDGVDWILEVHEASRYHVVERQSPNKTSRFGRCAKFLLDLSPGALVNQH